MLCALINSVIVFMMRFGDPFFFFLVGYHCFDEFIGPWAALFFVSYSNFQKIKIVIMRNISDV